MRMLLTAAAAFTLLAASAAAQSAYTDAQLQSFGQAMTAIRALGVTGSPSAEQQAAMASAIETAGLDIDTFNAISTAVSSDEKLQARLAVFSAPESPAGSVAASVTEDEIASFAPAYREIVEISGQVQNGVPTAEQQQAMIAAIAAAGMEVDRFNAIATALRTDERLRARVALADLG